MFYSLLPDCQDYITNQVKNIARAQSTMDRRQNDEDDARLEFKEGVPDYEQERLQAKRKRRRDRKKLNKVPRLRRQKRPEYVKQRDRSKKRHGYVAPYGKSIKYKYECLSNTLSDVQNRMANFLFQNYGLVITAEFQTKKMIAKARKRLKLPKPDFMEEDEWK